MLGLSLGVRLRLAHHFQLVLNLTLLLPQVLPVLFAPAHAESSQAEAGTVQVARPTCLYQEEEEEAEEKEEEEEEEGG